MSSSEPTTVLPPTTEISLNDEPVNGVDVSSPVSSTGTASPSIVGSSTVGSRLAGDAVGSRLASTGRDVRSQSLNDSARTSYPQPYAKNTGPTTGFGHIGTGASNKRTGTMSLQEVQQVAADKAEQMKSWSVKTYKCTKQILSEKLGRGTRTVDLEVEAKIEILKDTKKKYEQLVTLTKALANHFSSVIQTQKVLAQAFSDLSNKSQELQEEFQYNAESQIIVAKSGENLLSAINFFIGNISTLCAKTMEDSLLTVSKYESARVSYDAYKSELDAINALPRTEANIMKQANAQESFNSHKAAYDKLRSDVNVKLQFLDENRIKVMQKNLLLFHNAIAAYFAGNQQQLEGTLKQFSIKVASQDQHAASFLEKH